MLPQNRQFITKTNRNRYDIDSEGRDEPYEIYNDRQIKHEFFGYKIFGLVTNTPEHVYISKDTEQNLLLNIERIQNSQPLREYLGIDPNKPLYDYTEGEKTIIERKLNQLDDIGVQCFVGMLVGDCDLFGIGLDNVRVQGHKAFKIDPSDIKLPFNDLVRKEVYSEMLPTLLDYLKQKQEFLPHHKQGMPYFNFLFGLLNEEQKEQGIRAMYALLSTEAKDQLTEFAYRLGYDQAVVLALQENAKAILAVYDPEKKFANNPLPLNNVQQHVVFRDEQHFNPTQEIINSGNSRPVVTEKTYSEKAERFRILSESHSQIYNLLKSLNEKITSLNSSQDKLKEKKIKTLETAVSQLSEIYYIVSTMKTQEKVTRRELEQIYRLFEVASKNIITQLNLDPTESGDLNKLRRNVSDVFKKVSNALGTTMQYSSLQLMNRTQKAFNQSYAGFFHDIAIDQPPQRTMNNAGKGIDANNSESELEDDLHLEKKPGATKG